MKHLKETRVTATCLVFCTDPLWLHGPSLCGTRLSNCIWEMLNIFITSWQQALVSTHIGSTEKPFWRLCAEDHSLFSIHPEHENALVLKSEEMGPFPNQTKQEESITHFYYPGAYFFCEPFRLNCPLKNFSGVFFFPQNFVLFLFSFQTSLPAACLIRAHIKACAE